MGNGDNPGEHVAQVRLRIDPVHPAAFDERGDDRPMLAAAVRAARGSGSRPRREPACQNPVKAQKFVPPQKLSEGSRLIRGEAMDAVTGGPVPQQSALPQQATAVTPFAHRLPAGRRLAVAGTRVRRRGLEQRRRDDRHLEHGLRVAFPAQGDRRVQQRQAGADPA